MFSIKDCLYLISESWNLVKQSILVNSWHNLWPESLFIATDSDCDEINGFNTDPIKVKAKELYLYAKSIIKNQNIFEAAAIEEWIASDEITDQYQARDDQIIDSVLNQATNDDDYDEGE